MSTDHARIQRRTGNGTILVGEGSGVVAWGGAVSVGVSAVASEIRLAVDRGGAVEQTADGAPEVLPVGGALEVKRALAVLFSEAKYARWRGRKFGRKA